MKPELLHILQHSLGVNKYGQGKQYRNHYVAGPDNVEKCRELVGMGFMEEHSRNELSGGDPVFTVTHEGKLAVAQESPPPPKLTRGQKRYLEYLDSDGAFDNFKEFLIYKGSMP